MSRLGGRVSLILLPVLALAAFATSCQPAAPQIQSTATQRSATPTPTAIETLGSASFPLTVTGDNGRALTLKAPPKRIASLSPGHTEVLFAIGAGDLMVGADTFSDYPAAAQALPKVDYSQPNLEQMVALAPDLVIAVTRHKAAVLEMETLALPVLFRVEPDTLDGVVDLVRFLGRLTGHQEQAEEVAGAMERRISAIEQRLSGVAEGPVVFYELSPELYTVGPRSFIGDILTRLKVRNIAAGVDAPFPKLSQEQIIRQDPEVVILGDGSAGETPATVRARPGWDTLRAVRQGKVFVVVDRDIIHRPGPRVVEGMEFLARRLYPERFP